jgi:hypothetical protein
MVKLVCKNNTDNNGIQKKVWEKKGIKTNQRFTLGFTTSDCSNFLV